MSKKKICGIYKIENLINGKVYIGQSIDIHKRWKDHTNSLNGKYHCNKHLEKAWLKYGSENFIFEIIDECNPSELSNKEMVYIKIYDSYNSGYNMTIGGESPSLTPDIIKRISIANTGRKITEETRQKLIKSHLGQVVSDETRRIIGEKSHTNRNKVIQLNYFGEIIKIWDSLLDIQKNFIGENASNKTKAIRECVKRKRYTAYDYIWLYYEDYLINGVNLELYNKKKNKKSVNQIDKINNQIIETWESMTDAQNELGIDSYCISLCCNGKRKTAGGFKWEYEL